MLIKVSFGDVILGGFSSLYFERTLRSNVLCVKILTHVNVFQKDENSSYNTKGIHKFKIFMQN